jgi:hypothetical protein
MTENLLKELSTQQLLDMAILVIEEITALRKKPGYDELAEEKRTDLFMISREITLRNEKVHP